MQFDAAIQSEERYRFEKFAMLRIYMIKLCVFLIKLCVCSISFDYMQPAYCILLMHWILKKYKAQNFVINYTRTLYKAVCMYPIVLKLSADSCMNQINIYPAIIWRLSSPL